MRPIKFIHIPKCGGNSLKQALDISSKEHECAWCMKMRIAPLKWERSFVFSFVRNPFDRIASFYRFLKRGNNDFFDEGMTFKQWFYRTLVEKEEPYYYKELFFQPCFNWLSCDGETLDEIDFIGKVENFQEDFSKLTNILNIDAELPHLNRTNRKEEICYTPEMKLFMKSHFKKDFKTWYS